MNQEDTTTPIPLHDHRDLPDGDQITVGPHALDYLVGRNYRERYEPLAEPDWSGWKLRGMRIEDSSDLPQFTLQVHKKGELIGYFLVAVNRGNPHLWKRP